MAKPTKYATPICVLLSIIAIVAIIIGLVTSNALWIIILLLPAVAYEAYRTEGVSTRWASWLLLFLIIAEIICLLFNIRFDIASFLGQSHTYVASTYLPLGEITVVFPAIIATLSILLFIRTNGIYTKWLSVIIFVSMIVAVYIINPTGFQELIRSIFQSMF